MATDGPNLPGTGEVQGSGDDTWNNPTGIEAKNETDVAAANTVLSGQKTDILVGRNFGFALSNFDVLTDIKVDIRREATGGSADVDDNIIQIWNNGLDGTNKATNTNWASSYQTDTYNHAASVWGVDDLIESEIEATTFGIAIKAESDSGGANIRVAWVEMTLTYDEIVPLPGLSYAYILGAALALGLLSPALGGIVAVMLLWARTHKHRRTVTGRARSYAAC